MTKSQRTGRRKYKRARAEAQAQAELEAASASALSSEVYQDTRVTAADQEGYAFSTAGTELENLGSPIQEGLAPRRPAYLDDDSSTAASDITRKPSVHSKHFQDIETGRNGSSVYSSAEDEYDGCTQKPSLVLNTGKEIYNTRIFLVFDGVTNVPEIEDEALQYLFNPRFATFRNDNYYPAWVKKNLIVAFQGYILYQDCLTRQALKTFNNQNQKILARLQEDIGIAIKHPRHCGVLLFLLKVYKQARVDVISKALERGELPEDPSDPLTALLLELIDQCIMFEYDKIPLCSTPLMNTTLERIEQRSKTVRDALADPNKTAELFTKVGCLVPSEEQGLKPTRPWFHEGWVKKNVAPNAQTLAQPWKIDTLVLKSRGRIEGTDTSQVLPLLYSQAFPQKRTSNAAIAGELTTATANMDHWTHTYSEEGNGSSKRYKMSSEKD